MRWLVVVAASVGLLGAAGVAEAKTISGIVPDLPSAHAAGHPRAHTANLPYGGGPVLHTNRTHVIFWEPSGSGMSFDPGYEALVEQFLRRVAADSHQSGNVYGLTGQYTDAQGRAAYASSYGGATLDTARLPHNGCVEPPVTGPGWGWCLTDKQLQAEVERVVRAEHLPTGSTDVYFLVTPRGLGSCFDTSSTMCALGGSETGYCGYHSQSSPDDITYVRYAVIPYNAVKNHCQSGNPRPNGSTADPTLSTISHEHSEMVTDPAADAWIDGSGNEDGDLCITEFGPPLGGSVQKGTAWNEQIHGGHYYLQEEWSNADGGCQPRAKSARASFTTRLLDRPWAISLSARGTEPHGSTLSYLWFFGDSRTGHGESVSHHYRRPGRYRVVLRAIDSWRNWAYYAETLTVTARGRLAIAKSG